VVFGKVIRGYTEVVQRMAQVPVGAKSQPEVPLVISNCGELELRKKLVSGKRRNIRLITSG
jgi:peptidyl-prolyl isomerase G (cyclophilin G)